MKKGSGLVVALLGGAALFLLLREGNAKAASQKPSPTPTPDDGLKIAGCELDVGIPADIRATLVSVLQGATMAPDWYETLAHTLELSGYPKAAACVRQKASKAKSPPAY